MATLVLAAAPLLSSAAGFADCPQFFPKGRAPAIPTQPMQRELCFSEFAVLHSGMTKTPVFVVQRLNAQMLEQGRALKRHDRFYAEARLPSSERATLEDYKGSGYSRGHMAPAGDMSTPEGKAQSFSLANIAPQDASHNSGAWAKIEKDTRRYIERAHGDVFVFTGPLFEGHRETIGQNQVRVPSGFFKLVYDATTGRSWVYAQRNASYERAGAPVSYEELVNRTGLYLLR